MPQLTEIYASLMDDPDIIPPQDVSKEDYALKLAQQQMRQHENNEKALTLGLTKLLKNNNGHSTNGHSVSNGTNGHFPSAVDMLSEFLFKADGINRAARRVLENLGHSDKSIDEIVAGLGPDIVPKKRGRATVNERDIRDHIDKLNDGLVPTDEQRVTPEDHGLRMDNRSLQDAGWTQSKIDKMKDEQKTYYIGRIRDHGEDKEAIEAAEAEADEDQGDSASQEDAEGGEDQGEASTPTSPTPEGFPTIESHSDIENLSNAQLVELARHHGNAGIGNWDNTKAEAELNKPESKEFLVELLGNRMNLTPPAAATPEPVSDTGAAGADQESAEDEQHALRIREIHNQIRMGRVSGEALDLSARDHAAFRQHIADKETAGAALSNVEETYSTANRAAIDTIKAGGTATPTPAAPTPATPTPASAPVDPDAWPKGTAETNARNEIQRYLIRELGPEAGAAEFQRLKDEGLGTGDNRPSGINAGRNYNTAWNQERSTNPDHPHHIPPAEASPEGEGASTEGASAVPEPSDLDKAHAEIKEHVEAKGGTFEPDNEEFQAAFNENDFTQDADGAEAFIDEVLNHADLKGELPTYMGGTAPAAEDIPAATPAAIPAALVPEGDWPDLTPENLRTDKDDIEGEERFKWKGGGNLAKKYGLMHPNGAYTEAGHALLDTVGEHHKDVTDMLWGDDKGETLRDYIRNAKNKTIQARNDTLRADATKAGEEVDENKIQPLLKPGEGPKTTEKTLKAATMNQTMLTHLLPLLNNDEGNKDEDGHASHNWSENYDPKTGALLEGSEAHSPFNAEHFNYSDSGAGKLTQAILASLVKDAGAGGVHHHAAFLTHQLNSALEGVKLNEGESKEDLIERVQNQVVGSGIDTDDPIKLQDLTDAVGKTITDAGGPSDWQGNGNIPSPLSQIDEGAINIISQISGRPMDAATAEADYETEVPETHKELIDQAKEDKLLDHIVDEDAYGYRGRTKAEKKDSLSAKLATMDEDKLRKFLGTSDKAMKAKQAKADKETTTGQQTRTKGRKVAAKERTTAAQGRQADVEGAEDAEGDEPSVDGKQKREKMLHRLAGYEGIDTDDAEAMAKYIEEHGEDVYTNDEIRELVKSQHALYKNGKSQKSVADKARADKAKLANAQIHLNSGRFPSHEDFVKQFEEKNGRKPNDEETKTIHTEHVRNLMHYWHENQDSFVGTDAQNQFEEKIQDYLNNGADFKGLSEDIQNMDAQGIDLGDSKARDKYYEKKSYDEKQPQLSAEHHAERLRSALTDGHHDRRTAFDTDTGEAYSGHMRLNAKGNMEIVRSDEAGQDGGDIEHPESPNAPQLQHHKADGTLDEEAQALYQKSHEARHAMSRDDQAHANALENENSEHSGRIKEPKNEHEANVETSTQEYNDAKASVDATAKMQNRYADDAHEAGLKPHTQKHEEWDGGISEHELAHATEEKRFANMESNIHATHEIDMGKQDDWAANVHEDWEATRESVPEEYELRREVQKRDHQGEQDERSERQEQELQDSHDTFESEIRESQDFKDLSTDDPMYQQELQSRLQAVQEEHAKQIEEETAKQASEQRGLDIEEEDEHKRIDGWHDKIDERKDHEQRLIGNNTADALQQNTDDNQARHDSMVSALNERRAERGDPQITEGLTRGQRAGAGADGASLLAAERTAHDESHEAGTAKLQSERDSASASIKDTVIEKVGKLKSAKAQKDDKSTHALVAEYKASAKQRDANRAQLEAARPEKVSARTKATQEADTAFKNHMGQIDEDDESKRTVLNPVTEEQELLPKGSTTNPYTLQPLETVGNAEGHARASHALQNPELGATSEKKKEAHDEDEEGEDRDGKPQQTRMVDDTANPGEKKQQVWIPGRGKGWVDKDKMNDAMDSNADASKDTSSHPDGKVVIYPPGHFNAGTPDIAEGEEGHEPQSPAMVGHGGNLHAVADKHIDPDDPAVAAMGHDDYIANHLAGRLEGHDFSAGVHSGIDAAGLGLHTSDHPATKSSKQRSWDQGKESAKQLGSQWGAKFKEGQDEVADKHQKKLKAEAVDESSSPKKRQRAVQALAAHIESSSAAAETVSEQPKVFGGASDWLKNKGIGVGEGVAEGMRSARLERSQAPKKGAFGRYIGDTGDKASLSSEIMRLPGLRHLKSGSMVIDHSLEDEAQRKSNLNLLQDHIKERADKKQKVGKS